MTRNSVITANAESASQIIQRVFQQNRPTGANPAGSDLYLLQPEGPIPAAEGSAIPHQQKFYGGKDSFIVELEQ